MLFIRGYEIIIRGELRGDQVTRKALQKKSATQCQNTTVPKGSNLLNNELLALPYAAGHPQAAVDQLGIALVGRLDGAEHAETVLARVNVLGLAGAEEYIEDVAGAGEGASRAHLKAAGLFVSK